MTVKELIGILENVINKDESVQTRDYSNGEIHGEVTAVTLEIAADGQENMVMLEIG